MSEHKTSWMAADSSGNGRFVEHEKTEEEIWLICNGSFLNTKDYA